jgi:hypothetical protein
MQKSPQSQIHLYTNLPQTVVKNAGTGSPALAAELNRPPARAVRMQLPEVGNLHKIDDNLCQNNP